MTFNRQFVNLDTLKGIPLPFVYINRNLFQACFVYVLLLTQCKLAGAITLCCLCLEDMKLCFRSGAIGNRFREGQQSAAPQMVMLVPDYDAEEEYRRRRPQMGPNKYQRPVRPIRPILQGYLAAIQSLPALQALPSLLPFHLPPPLLPGPLSRNYEEDIADYVARIEDSLGSEDSSVVLASSDDQRTSLILKPVAKAVAGPRGVAVASPVAKAVLRRGQPVEVEFDPDAVAIAGPGGEAHAHPKLIISYANDTHAV